MRSALRRFEEKEEQDMARNNITDRQLGDLERSLLRSWADRTLRAINELESLYEVLGTLPCHRLLLDNMREHLRRPSVPRYEDLLFIWQVVDTNLRAFRFLIEDFSGVDEDINLELDRVH